ncbi:hypothetical protein BRD00_11065 [Halobacteriales archaeon QS_8_69_26]|nr:MAG: hypothetical protein BRD00_11065 [Halobacteriales archaeon QS_8_69_26]
MVDAYEIPFSTTSYGVLYHVMLSKVDNIDSPSRAIRIQALRNFHRGLWIASWYAFSFITIAGLVDFLFDPRDRIPALGWEYTRPAYFEYWEPIWHLAVLSGFGIMGFWYLSESTEEDYIEYLFADYAVAVGDTENTFVLGTESELSLSGDVGMLREDGAEESDHTEDREQG